MALWIEEFDPRKHPRHDTFINHLDDFDLDNPRRKSAAQRFDNIRPSKVRIQCGQFRSDGAFSICGALNRIRVLSDLICHFLRKAKVRLCIHRLGPCQHIFNDMGHDSLDIGDKLGVTACFDLRKVVVQWSC